MFEIPSAVVFLLLFLFLALVVYLLGRLAPLLSSWVGGLRNPPDEPRDPVDGRLQQTKVGYCPDKNSEEIMALGEEWAHAASSAPGHSNRLLLLTALIQGAGNAFETELKDPYPPPVDGELDRDEALNDIALVAGAKIVHQGDKPHGLAFKHQGLWYILALDYVGSDLPLGFDFTTSDVDDSE